MMKMQSTIEATKAAADLQAYDSGPMVALARYLASKRVLPFYYALAAGVLIIVSFALVMMAIRNDQEASTVFTDVATFLINLLVTLALFYGALLSYFYRKRVRV
jgi:hypothetical protein